ncbi:hypothetical protein EVAR_37091_1 [Eumeta japonica]|uniref:Uncharacterized protein n=1 Tax=Eumeta variegata TaxID=151549 RepID=A0A4C1XRR0_EUMVA|nr:hypothetical protein EVAR_37091_1 [Eumeta japonica]
MGSLRALPRKAIRTTEEIGRRGAVKSAHFKQIVTKLITTRVIRASYAVEHVRIDKKYLERNHSSNHENVLRRPVRYHALREYSYEVAASAIVLNRVSENFGGPLALHSPTPSSSPYSPTVTTFPVTSLHSCSIRYTIPIQKVTIAFVSSLELRVSVGGGGHLLFDSSHARLFLQNTKKIK